MARVYVHSGKLGDIVFSIPAYRFSRADLYALTGSDEGGQFGYSAAAVVPLLEYSGVRVEVWRRGGVVSAAHDWVNGDAYRGRWERREYYGWHGWFNLAERELLAVGWRGGFFSERWLDVEGVHVADYVFNRSPRYRPIASMVDWRDLARRARGRSVFLGLREERDSFCAEFGEEVPFYPTSDLLEAARVIAGSRCFFGNQSSLQAVAAGLRHRQLLERCERIDVCRLGYSEEYLSSDLLLRRFGGLP